MAAAALSCRCSSVVFVGNIPYQASEKELRDACEEIGPVVSLRVATDKDSGKPRGYAFCEYRDDETAQSACRNLHGHALRGRALRVGLVDRAAVQKQARRSDPHQPVGIEDATHAASLVSGRPSGAVTTYLAGQSRRQIRELLHVLETQRAEFLEQAKREYRGLATLIEQAKILLDMAVPEVTAEKRPRGLPESGEGATKMRKLDDGQSVPGVACR